MLIVNLLETQIDYSEKLYCDNNYKDQLLRYHHIQEWSHPKYNIICSEGPAHRKKYIVGVQRHDITDNDNKYIGYGIGNKHKEGEQQSAKMALIIYGVLNDDQYTQADIFYPIWNSITDKYSITNNISDIELNIDNNQIVNDNIYDNLDIDDKSVCSEKSV